MTLLAPITALIGAALAVPALLALYFLRLRRRAVRVSSTMLWEQAAADIQVNVPWKMIRSSLLLLLHLLTLAMLLLALGRPAVEGEWGASDQVYIVIDHSGSMNATDGIVEGTPPSGPRPTRLEQAKRRAQQMIDGMGRAAKASTFTLIEAGARARVVAPPTTDTDLVRKAIDSIGPTDQPGSARDAVELVSSLVGATRQGETGGPSALVAIFSDGEGFVTPLAVPRARVVFERAGGAPNGGNVGITSVSASRDYDDPATLRAFVRLTNSSALDASVMIRVTQGGELRAAESTKVPGATSEGAGEAALTLSLRDLEGGAFGIGFERQDLIASDNQAWVVVPPARRPSVLVVAEGGEGDPFLMDVLGALGASLVRELDEKVYASAPLGDIARYDIVIFDRVTPERLPDVPTISFGATIPGVEPGAEAGGNPGTTPALAWDRASDLLRDARLGELVVGKRVRLPEADRVGEGLRVRELARGKDGPLILEVVGEPRRVVVGFGVSQSNWALDYGFPIFLASSVELLTSGSRAGQGASEWYRTDEVASAPIESGERVVQVRGPIEREISPSDEERASGRVSLGVLPRAGLYTVSGGALVAVNMADALETEARVQPVEVAQARADGSAREEQGLRELWHWFVLAALGLLIIEWGVFALRARV